MCAIKEAPQWSKHQSSEMFEQRKKVLLPSRVYRISWGENLNGGRANSWPFGPGSPSQGANLHLSKVPHEGLNLATCVPWEWPTGCLSFMQHGRSRTMPFSASEMSTEMQGQECSLAPPGVQAASGAEHHRWALARPAVVVSSRCCPFLAWEAVAVV